MIRGSSVDGLICPLAGCSVNLSIDFFGCLFEGLVFYLPTFTIKKSKTSEPRYPQLGNHEGFTLHGIRG